MCQKIKIINCHHCSESFEAKRKNHRYCSASCRVMACYKRKGYTYVSGHYKKPTQLALVAVTAESISPTPSQVPTHIKQKENTPPQAQGMTGSGVMESVVGAGAIAAGKYLLYDKPLMDMVKELHEVLVAKPRRILQQQTKGMGMQPLPFPSSSPPSHTLNTKRLGIDSNPFNGSMMMGT